MPPTLTPELLHKKEEGTITTPFDMTVLNDPDRFHLVMDTVDRLPQIRNWKWPIPESSSRPAS